MTLMVLIKDGKIWIENGAYVAMASDGVIVQLGTVGDEKNTDEYLKTNPNPENW